MRGASGEGRSGCGFVADGLQKTQAGHFRLEGLQVDCARAGPEYSWGGRGLAGSRTLPRLGCWQAGNRSRGAGAGRSLRAHLFKFHSGRRPAREPGPRECGSAGVGSGGTNEGTVRGLTTPGLGSISGPAGSRRCERRRGIARGACAAVGGRAGQGAGNEKAGGGPLADPLPRSTRVAC